MLYKYKLAMIECCVDNIKCCVNINLSLIERFKPDTVYIQPDIYMMKACF